MKKLLLATTAVFALAADSAGAADLTRPVYKAAPAAPPCAAAPWQGAYIGVSGGGVNYTANRTDQDGYLTFVEGPATFVQKEWGGIAGGQIGYNWAKCNTLFGIEIDGSWVGAKADTALFPGFPGGTVNIESRLDALVTARARTGFVMDNVLFYLTGGVAAVHTKTTYTNDFFNGPAFLEINEKREWRWGWVAGFGTEWAWSDRVSVRSEVLYVDVVDRDFSFASANFDAPVANFKHSDSLWVSRIGLNVKLGGAPVMAKY